METLFVFLLIGVAGYFFFKANTARGVRTVRAYLYLMALDRGLSVQEANRVAQHDVLNGPTDIPTAARSYVQRMYGGKQLPMIAEAERLGFKLYQPSVRSVAQEAKIVDEPEWVRGFILYYAASEMLTCFDNTLPDNVQALINGEMNKHTEHSLLANLQNYLGFIYKRNWSPEDLAIVRKSSYIFLRAELAHLNSRLALRHYIRRMHVMDENLAITDKQIDDQVSAIATMIQNADDTGLRIRNLMLKDSISQLFESRHRKSLNVFTDELVTYFNHT